MRKQYERIHWMMIVGKFTVVKKIYICVCCSSPLMLNRISSILFYQITLLRSEIFAIKLTIIAPKRYLESLKAKYSSPDYQGLLPRDHFMHGTI